MSCFTTILDSQKQTKKSDGRTSHGHAKSQVNDKHRKNQSADNDSKTKKQETSNKLRLWFEILGVSSSASPEEITLARNKLVHQLHPDRLKSIEGLSSEIEKFANDKLAEVNVAYDEAMHLRDENYKK